MSSTSNDSSAGELECIQEHAGGQLELVHELAEPQPAASPKLEFDENFKVFLLQGVSPSDMKQQHLELLESPNSFTVMSHEIVLKTLLRFHQTFDSPFIAPAESSISTANFAQLINEFDMGFYDPQYGPFASKVKEGSFSALDMCALDRLLPYYVQSLHNHEPSRFHPSTRINQGVSIPVDLHENKAAKVPDAGKPLELVTKWQSKRDPMFAFRMLHQPTVGPNSKFAADGVLYSISKAKAKLVMYPVVQLERAGGITNQYDRAALDTKIAESMAYFQYLVCQQGPNRHPILSVRYTHDLMSLDVLYESEGRPARIPLVDKIPRSSKSWHAMLSCMALWAYHFSEQVSSNAETTMLKPGSNQIEIDGFIYKMFRYGSSRAARLFFSFVPGTEWVLNKSFSIEFMYDVIRYPKIQGAHWPSTLQHVVSLLTVVVNLHQSHNIVHGDIRLFNIVFSEDNRAHLIDWDLSGNDFGKVYPEGFNHDIGNDGQRHPDAVAGETMLFSHDVFAVMYLLNLFQVQDSDHQASLQATYKDLVSQPIESTDDLAKLLDQLKTLPGDLAIAANPGSETIEKASFSPLKVPKASDSQQPSNAPSDTAADASDSASGSPVKNIDASMAALNLSSESQSKNSADVNN